MKVIDPIIVTDAVMISTNVIEADAPAHSMAATYILDEVVIVIAANIHYVFRSLQNANTGHNPLTEPADITTAVWWLKLGVTNRWKPFDGILDAQATNAEIMTYMLNAPGRVDSIVLLNCSAKQVHIKQTDLTFGVVYDKTYSLIDMAGINDYYQYFFSPIDEITDFAVTDLPNYANTTIEITLTQPNGNVKIGEIVVGQKNQVGLTKDQASLSWADYSIKKVNQFGDADLQEGAYSREQELSLTVATDEISRTLTFLAKRRAKKLVFIATEKHSATIVYGWYESIKQLVSYEDYSVLNIKTKGLR